MTKAEFIEKYGDAEVTFCEYYKYIFHYEASLPDGSKLRVGYGGNADDIYRYTVTNNETVKVRDLDPDEGSVFKEGKETDSFWDH